MGVLTDKCAIQHLKKLAMENKQLKYPNVPPEWLAPAIYKDKTANGLTKCIIDFLTFNGWQAERINSTGRQIDRRQTVTDVLGHSRIIGSHEWIKGSGVKGTADISATVAGRSIKIEVKIGADKQSEAQCKYQSIVERAGGIYFIAKDFQGFYSWYFKTFQL